MAVTQVDICNLALKRIGANVIAAIDESTKEAEHCNAFWDYILDEVLEEIPWNFTKVTRKLDYVAGYGFVDADTDTKDITGITKASPAVVTAVAHGVETGQHIYITDVGGMTEINDQVYYATDTDTDTITLTGIDSTLFTTYTSGGTLILKEPAAKYANGYAYDIPSDYQIGIHLDCGTPYEIAGSAYNRRLLTTADGAILHYIAAETTVANFTTRFISVLAYRLAAELALPLGKKGAKQEKMLQLYEYQVGKRGKHDAQADAVELDDSDPWLDDGGFTV